MRIKIIMKRILQALRILLFAVVALILVGNIYTAAAKNIFGQKNPTFFGYSSSVVLTGSMSGTIEPNDLIITKKQNGYSEGDIITFSGQTSVTHRIIGIENGRYRTKGDANNTADSSAVFQEDIIGKVVAVIPKIGAVIGFVRQPAGFIVCFLILIAMAELPGIIERHKAGKQK